MLPTLGLLASLIARSPGADTEDVDRYRRMMAAAPGNGDVMYRLAKALASAGQAEEAVRWLAGALDQGLDVDLGDPVFKPLAARTDFLELQQKADRPGVSTSHVAFRLAEKDLIPEGIAWDPVSGDFFVGSLYKKKIVRVAASGGSRDFVGGAQDGLEDVLGLKVDAERRRLWACTAAGGRAGEKAGASALFEYDLESGRLVKAFWLDNRDGKHLLNDIALTAEGDVFVTDSEAGILHRLPAGGSALEAFVGPGTFIYPNGIALSADRQHLYVADFKQGLSIVDLKTKAVSALPHPKEVSTAGIDGLSAHEGALVAIQNGVQGRERVVRYVLSDKGDRIERLEVLESRNPFFRTPTTGVLAAGDFVFLANPNLEALDDDGNLKPGMPLEEVVVLGTPLSARP
jgi:sugar lactone lactonase YvrE